MINKVHSNLSYAVFFYVILHLMLKINLLKNSPYELFVKFQKIIFAFLSSLFIDFYCLSSVKIAITLKHVLRDANRVTKNIVVQISALTKDVEEIF